MLKTIIARIFARSLKHAHQQWQDIEAKRQSHRRFLTHKIEATRIAAQSAGVDTPESVGLLRQANQRLAKPPSRQLLNVHVTISNIFVVRGTSRWRSAPATLPELIKKYETLIEPELQDWQGLLRRLRLVREVLEDMQQHPEYAAGLSPRYVLEYPEYAEALFELGQAQWHDRQVCLARLQKSFDQRIHLGHCWLQLLRNNMSSYQYRLEKRGLDTFVTRVSSPQVPDLQQWLNFHTRLDNPLLRLNTLGVESLGNGS